MSAFANEEYQLKSEHREFLRRFDELYSDPTSVTDADIFDVENMVSLDDIIRVATGEKIAFYSFKRSYEARERISTQTEKLAKLLEAGGISTRIKDGKRLFLKTHVTKQVIELPKYRNINFLPSVAQRNRRELLKDFEYFMTTDARLKNARYYVITSGVRVPFDGRKSSLREKIRTFKKQLQRWRNEVCARNGVSVIFQGIEFTRDEDKTYHVHANVVILPPEHMLDISGPEYTEFYIETQDFLPHFDDSGKIESLRDFVKYPFKPADLSTIDCDEAVWLYHNTFNIRMFELLSSLKDFSRTRKMQKLRVVRVGRNLYLRSDDKLLVEMKRAENAKETKQPHEGTNQLEPSHKEERMSRRKELKNCVVGVLLPNAYATPWKEAATVWLSLDGSEDTFKSESAPDAEYVKQSIASWYASYAPLPQIALEIAENIRKADDQGIEDYEADFSNVHSNTITSNPENRDQNNPFKHDPDPPDFGLNTSEGYQHAQEIEENTSTSPEDENACPDFLAIFDGEEIETEKFYFRGELVQRDIVEDCLKKL